MFRLFLMIAASFSLQANAKTGSVYSNVEPKNCVLVDGSELEAEPEIDYGDWECPAFGGYRVNISGGDIRYNLKLRYNNIEISTPQPTAFHDMGASLIEWRFNRTNTTTGQRNLKFTALIYRINYSVDFNKNSEKLVVMRLNGKSSCYLGSIDKQPGMNEKARQLADDTSATCVDVSNF